jgi:hypothetical protein
MILDIETVGGTQVGVAIIHSRIEAGGIDLDLNARRIGVPLVCRHGANEALEPAPDCRKHHVLDREFNRGVGRVDLPIGCTSMSASPAS